MLWFSCKVIDSLQRVHPLLEVIDRKVKQIMYFLIRTSYCQYFVYGGSKEKKKKVLALNRNGNVYLCLLLVIKKLFPRKHMTRGVKMFLLSVHINVFGFWTLNCNSKVLYNFYLSISVVCIGIKVKRDEKRKESKNKLMFCRYIRFVSFDNELNGSSKTLFNFST